MDGRPLVLWVQEEMVMDLVQALVQAEEQVVIGVGVQKHPEGVEDEVAILATETADPYQLGDGETLRQGIVGGTM